MLMVGSILEVDPAHQVCRVKIGSLNTAWLQWLTPRAGHDKTWWAPEVGEACLVLSPSGELNQGLVLLGLNTKAFPPPSHDPDVHTTVYKDGTSITHDRKNSLLTIDSTGDVVVKGARTLRIEFGGNVLVKTPAEVTIDAPQVTITDKLHVQGHVTFDAGMSGSGDVVSGGISLEHHVTTEVRAGPDRSGPPA